MIFMPDLTGHPDNNLVKVSISLIILDCELATSGREMKIK